MLLQRSEGGFGGLLGRRGASESPGANLVNHMRFTKGTSDFWRVEALLGRILEASWAFGRAS
eukprot:1520576-Pyramimonas_sp.AAC.1